MRDEVYTKIWTVNVAAAGEVAIPFVFGGHIDMNGFIEQVMVRASSGGGATVDVNILTDRTSTDQEYVIYNNLGAALPLVDSAINAPFDTRSGPDTDLSIYLKGASAGTFVVRVDFRLLGRNG